METKYIVRATSGEINRTASLEAFGEYLDTLIGTELPADQVDAVVSAVLEAAQAPVVAETLIGVAVGRLGGDSSNWSMLSERVHAHLKNRVETGSLFVIKGAGGGYSLSPREPKPAKTSKKSAQ